MAALAGPYLVAVGLLGVAGASKVARPAGTARALREMRLPNGPGLVRTVAAAELFVAVVALAGGGRAVAALIAVAYLGFAAFLIAALRRAAALSSCGCFAGDTPPSAAHLVVNLTLAAVAAAVALGAPGGGGLVEVTGVEGSVWLKAAFVALTLAAGWLAHMALTRLPQLSQAARA